MVLLNKPLQKVRVEPKIRFISIKYASLGSIFVFLIEKIATTMFLPQRLIVLIRIVEAMDKLVILVELLEQQHRPKRYKMLLEQYFRPENMKILKKEVESLTDILLNTIPPQLVGKNLSREKQKSNNKCRSAIVINPSNKIVEKRPIANCFCFGGAIKKVEKYWKAGYKLVYMKCFGIRHKSPGTYGNKPKKCRMCVGTHLTSKHQRGKADIK